MRLGILGGGQLGRMLALSAHPLGCRVRVLAEREDAPAGVAAELIVADATDPAALDRFARGLDVVTYEFENVPAAGARALAGHVPVRPPPAALEAAQDRVSEKRLFHELGLPTAEFETVDSRDDLDAAVARLGLPAVLKTRRLGYDGKGQRVLRRAPDLDPAWAALGGVPLLLERFVPFDRELSVLAARRPTGETVVYPLVENHHDAGILRLSRAPAPGAAGLQGLAEDYARRVLDALDYAGVLAIELFEAAGSLLANEMAPRVHNSGHWTIEGAETSQFENHVRAVLDLPLGSTAPRGFSAMVNLIGEVPPIRALLEVGHAHLHLYGKTARPGRKLGHVTVVADTPAGLEGALERVLAVLRSDPGRGRAAG